MLEGTSTAALGAGGYTDSNVALQNLWNGTTWTEVNDLNTARRDGAGGMELNCLYYCRWRYPSA
jgi:hypothetical protein